MNRVETLGDRRRDVQCIFLVGCPRSGTTLLQALLSANPAICSFPETHLFDRSHGSGVKGLLKSLVGGYLAWRALEDWKQELSDRQREAVDQWPSRPIWRRRTLLLKWRQIADQIARETGAEAWLEKTPGHLHHLDVIQDLVPDASFLHLVRDGRAVTASIYQVSRQHPQRWGGPYDLGIITKRWNRCVADTLGFLGQENHIAVLYEDVATRPEKTLQFLSRRLPIPYSESMTDPTRRASDQIVSDHEEWKTAVEGPIEYKGLGKFHDVLDEKQQGFVNEKLHWDLWERLMTSVRSQQGYPGPK